MAAWIDEYNTIRRHSAIGMISPAAWEASQNRRTGSMNDGRQGSRKPGDGFAAAHPRVRGAGSGSAPPGSRLLRIANATACAAP